MSKSLQIIQMLLAKRDALRALISADLLYAISHGLRAILAPCHKPRARCFLILPRAATRHVLSSMPHAVLGTSHSLSLPSAVRHMPFALSSYYVLFLFLATACSTLRSTTPETALAYVNGEAVTLALMETAFTESHQGHSAFLAGKGVVREVLDKVIDKQLLLQEARRIGLDHEPEIETALERQRAALASQKFFQDKIATQLVITEEAHLEAHRRMGLRFQARHILVDSNEAAQKAYDRVQAGEDFGKVAIEVSQADTAGKGGYMGIVSWGRLDPDLEDKLWSLNLGEVSEPFKTREGWNLLYVTDKRPAPTPPLEKATPQIRSVLNKRETTRRSELLLRDLEQRWKPQVNEAALRAIVEARNKEELSADTVLLDFGGEKILMSQLLPRIDFQKVQKLADPIALRALHTLLEGNIFDILVKKEALAQGYGKRAEIEKEVESLRNRLAVEYLLSRVVFATLDASDEEARTYWESHKDKFTEPAAVKYSMIVTNSASNAQQILADLKTGVDFAVAARKVSTHAPTANLGGEMGWVTKGQLEPALESLVFSLKTGELGSTQVKDSHLVIRIDEVKRERLKPVREVGEQVRQLVLQEKSRATLKNWLTKLREAAVIEIDNEAVSQAVVDYEEKIRQKAGQTHG